MGTLLNELTIGPRTQKEAVHKHLELSRVPITLPEGRLDDLKRVVDSLPPNHYIRLFERLEDGRIGGLWAYVAHGANRADIAGQARQRLEGVTEDLSTAYELGLIYVARRGIRIRLCSCSHTIKVAENCVDTNADARWQSQTEEERQARLWA